MILQPEVLENFIDQDATEHLKKMFYSNPFSRIKLPNNMIALKKKQEINYLAELLDINAENITLAHFYKHVRPHYPYTDYHKHEISNIVIPLEVSDESIPHLVIFDQVWDNSANTWVFEDKQARFEYNKELLGRPCDYDILHSTNKEVDEDLYSHLDHQPKDYWYGLSGKAYPFTSGNVIKFDAKSIHATSNMTCDYKLGLTIRLDIPFK